MKIPQNFIIQKIYQFAGYPKYNRSRNVYNAGCPICREGKSWGKKRRLYYFIDNNYIYCHNCDKSYSPIDWICQVSGQTYNEVVNEISKNDYDEEFITPNIPEKPKNIEKLPHSSINLNDKNQLEFYKNNLIINDCLAFIKKRKMDLAINKPPNYYISLTDFIHKNRLCLPFYDIKDNIIFYQTRAIYKKDEDNFPKYLSKINSNKTIFNINNINPQMDYIFIFEGPIDSMFVQNGIAIGGTSLNNTQRDQLNEFKFFKKIWVPDCQWIDEAGLKTSKALIEEGETVFIWPEKFKGFKDINDVCIACNLTQIKPEFFIKNSYSNMDGLIQIQKVNQIIKR
jgi:hypothetical protein